VAAWAFSEKEPIRDVVDLLENSVHATFQTGSHGFRTVYAGDADDSGGMTLRQVRGTTSSNANSKAYVWERSYSPGGLDATHQRHQDIHQYDVESLLSKFAAGSVTVACRCYHH
jgi:hypothetical protein